MDLKKGFDKALENIPVGSEEIPKLNRYQPQIVVETTYGLNPY